MRTRLACFASALVLAACSASAAISPGDSSNVADGGEGTGGDGGSTGSQSPATWSALTPDPAAAVKLVAGDARGVWAVLGATPDDTSPQQTVRAGQLALDGSYTEKYAVTKDQLIVLNYLIMSLTPIDDSTALIGGEQFLSIIGGGAPHDVAGDSIVYISGVYGRTATDLWAGTRVGTLNHYDGSSFSTYRVATATTPIMEPLTTRALWQSKDTLFFAAEQFGLRSVALPIPSDFNGDTRRVITGNVQALAGDTDDDAFAVGSAGLVAHYDGTGWAPQASGSAVDLTGLAVHDATDVWAIGDGALLHYDGKAWASVTEAGMPSGGNSVAAASDGTLFVTSGGNLYRRSPGAVNALPTNATVDAGNGDMCGIGEPNDVSEQATEESPTFTASGCIDKTDTDVYSFVTPSGKAGGYAAITLTDTSGVHPSLSNDIVLSTYQDNFVSMFDSVAGDQKHLYLPIKNAERKTLTVASTTTTQGVYGLDVQWHSFDDAYEPNDTLDEAATITSGTPIQAFLPSGFARSVDVNDEPDVFDAADYYEVQRPAGSYSITVTNVPADSKVRIIVGTTMLDGALGAPVTFTATQAAAGKVTFAIEDIAPRTLNAAAPPGAYTQPYSLVVGN